MFGLPKPEHKEVYYGRMFLELCKLLPAIPPAVSRKITQIVFLTILTGILEPSWHKQ